MKIIEVTTAEFGFVGLSGFDMAASCEEVCAASLNGTETLME
jgi:hypothetical protein